MPIRIEIKCPVQNSMALLHPYCCKLLSLPIITFFLKLRMIQLQSTWQFFVVKVCPVTRKGSVNASQSSWTYSEERNPIWNAGIAKIFYISCIGWIKKLIKFILITKLILLPLLICHSMRLQGKITLTFNLY